MNRRTFISQAAAQQSAITSTASPAPPISPESKQDKSHSKEKRISSIGHLSISTVDVGRTVSFYPDSLGMEFHHGICYTCFQLLDIQKEYEQTTAARTSFNCPPKDWEFAKASYDRGANGKLFEWSKNRTS